MALGGPAEIFKLVQTEGPMLAVDEDEIEVDLPQNVDHPWGGEGKIVTVRFPLRAHGGFDSVGLLHCMSSCVLATVIRVSVDVRPIRSGQTLHRAKLFPRGWIWYPSSRGSD
jgi:hypothetical protein